MKLVYRFRDQIFIPDSNFEILPSIPFLQQQKDPFPQRTFKYTTHLKQSNKKDYIKKYTYTHTNVSNRFPAEYSIGVFRYHQTVFLFKFYLRLETFEHHISIERSRESIQNGIIESNQNGNRDKTTGILRVNASSRSRPGEKLSVHVENIIFGRFPEKIRAWSMLIPLKVRWVVFYYSSYAKFCVSIRKFQFQCSIFVLSLIFQCSTSADNII